MKKETTLSKETIEEQGIDIKITQNDIIDVLVEEQINEYLKEYEEIMSDHLRIYNLIKMDIQQKAEEVIIIMRKDIPKGVKEVSKHHNFNADYNSTYYDKFLRLEETQYARKIYSYTTSFGTKGVISCKLMLEKVIGGLNFTSFKTAEIPYELPSHLLEAVKLKEEYVKKFLDSFPSEGINERKIAKTIKNQFTKEFMKSMSPDFKKSINKSFKLKLN
jgi:hypothetical protein